MLAILDEPEVAAWWRRDEWERLDETDAVSLVIDLDGATAGCIQYHEETDPDYFSAAVDVFVSAAVHGRGVGPDAMRTLLAWLIDVRGHHRLTVDPAAANARAVHVYEKLGFRLVGVLRQYERVADGSRRDALLMELLAAELVRGRGRVSAALYTTTGLVPFRGHHTWYGIVGTGEEPGSAPLVVCHGGPGFPHDALEPLAALARGRRVVFYDQLGCGRSDHPHDPSLWSVELFEAELGALRAALGLDRCHLLGQSWGGSLALAHAAGGRRHRESYAGRSPRVYRRLDS